MRCSFLALALMVSMGCGSQSEPAPAIPAKGEPKPSKVIADAASAPHKASEPVIEAGSRPRPRAGHELVYHDRLKMSLLVNAAEDEGPATKIWGWNGQIWTLLVSDGPQPRGLGGVAYDEKRGLLVLYGGRSLKQDHTDMWTWDGRRWEKIGATPGRVSNHFFMVRDPDRDRIVLFGGQEAVRDQKMRAKEPRETWEWDAAG